jgi:hypothetical protein
MTSFYFLHWHYRIKEPINLLQKIREKPSGNSNCGKASGQTALRECVIEVIVIEVMIRQTDCNHQENKQPGRHMQEQVLD